MHKKQIGVLGRSSYAAMAFASAALTLGGGCAKKHVSMPHSTLGKVVIYRNGVAYYERTARPVKGKLTVAVPSATAVPAAFVICGVIVPLPHVPAAVIWYTLPLQVTYPVLPSADSVVLWLIIHLSSDNKKAPAVSR